MANPTPLQRRQTGYRLPAGSWFNDIIDRVNNLIAGTVTGYFKGTFDGTVGATTPSTASVTDITTNGVETRLGQTVAAAGATQGTATQITKSTVFVTVTASTQGVKLPTAATGKRVTIFAAQTVGVKVYPSTGDNLSGSATNAAVVLAAGKANIYQAIDANVWRVLKGA